MSLLAIRPIPLRYKQNLRYALSRNLHVSTVELISRTETMVVIGSTVAGDRISCEELGGNECFKFFSSYIQTHTGKLRL